MERNNESRICHLEEMKIQNGRALFLIPSHLPAKFTLPTNALWAGFSFVGNEKWCLILLRFAIGQRQSLLMGKWWVAEVKKIKSRIWEIYAKAQLKSGREGFECKTEDKANAYLHSIMLLEPASIIIFSAHRKCFQMRWKWNMMKWRFLVLKSLYTIIYFYIQTLYVNLSVSWYWSLLF